MIAHVKVDRYIIIHCNSYSGIQKKNKSPLGATTWIIPQMFVDQAKPSKRVYSMVYLY